MSLRPFRSTRLLACLNVVAVGASLAAITSALLQAFMDLAPHATGASTFLVGCTWAALLRWPRRVRGVRVGWLLSLPLAPLNAAIAGIILSVSEGGLQLDHVAWMTLMMITIGAIVWLPALLLTLLLFGVPIAQAERLAAKGLAGRERGEWIVGAVCVAMGVLALAVVFGSAPHHPIPLIAGLAATAILTGVSSTTLALARESRRRAFVKRVMDGEEAAFRILSTPEGGALVRVDEQGGYRVACFDEVATLDSEGEVVRTTAADLGKLRRAVGP